MSDLIYKLPGGNTATQALSDSTYIALLNTIRVVVDKHVENARSLQELGGIEKVTTINNSRFVCFTCFHLLFVLWECCNEIFTTGLYK